MSDEIKLSRAARTTIAALKAKDKQIVTTVNNAVKRWLQARQDIIGGVVESVRDEVDSQGFLEAPDLALPKIPREPARRR